MVEMKVLYTGDLHCELTHGPSGSTIETDAPTDNNGRGERFSPTDLLGASLASCVLTTMAIMAERNSIDIHGAKARVTKEMNPQPRRVARLAVEVTMPGRVPEKDRARLEAAAHACPVKKSLSPEVETPISFTYEG